MATSYEGDPHFENLTGSTIKQQQWVCNRQEAYKGSFLHFFRAVFNNTTQSEGFEVYQIIRDNNQMVIDPQGLPMNPMVTLVDKEFKSIKFDGFKQNSGNFQTG